MLDPSMQVLVVDDEDPVINVLGRLLRRIGLMHVDAAHDGLEALALLREKRYRLVISDLRMEPLGGLELVQAMRADWDLQYIDVLVMAAATELADLALLQGAGVGGYLVKPFTASMLRSKIEGLYRGRPSGTALIA